MATALRLMRRSSVQQLQRAIKVLDQRGAAFNPVTIVAVQHAVNVAHLGAVDMAAHHSIKVVTVDHPQLAAIGSGVYGFPHHFNVTKAVANKFTCKLIMIARYKHYAAAFAGTFKQLLHHIVVCLRPVPFAAHLRRICGAFASRQ